MGNLSWECRRLERRWPFALGQQQMMTARVMIATTKIAAGPLNVDQQKSPGILADIVGLWLELHFFCHLLSVEPVQPPVPLGLGNFAIGRANDATGLFSFLEFKSFKRSDLLVPSSTLECAPPWTWSWNFETPPSRGFNGLESRASPRYPLNMTAYQAWFPQHCGFSPINLFSCTACTLACLKASNEALFCLYYMLLLGCQTACVLLEMLLSSSRAQMF